MFPLMWITISDAPNIFLAIGRTSVLQIHIHGIACFTDVFGGAQCGKSRGPTWSI
jgi:hypothetical protein